MSKQPPTCMEEPGRVRRGAQGIEIEVEREHQGRERLSHW